MNEISFKDSIQVIKKNKRLITLIMILFAMIAGIVTYVNTEPNYKTYTSLIMEETSKSDDADNNYKYIDQKFMNTYKTMVKSRLVINEVRENLKLDLSFKELSESIEVNVVPDTDIVKIEVSGKKPELIAKIADEMAKVSVKQLESMTEAKTIKILDKANIPGTQKNSISKSNIIAAAIVGLLIGISLAFLLEHLDSTVKTPIDIEKHFKLPVVGIIQKTEDELVLDENPNSFVAENYRTIATNLKSLRLDKEIKNILITSPKPAEDKDLVSINLAIAMAKSGEKVLLIDSDIRKPKIHKYFNIDNNLGLSNVLKGNNSYDEVIKEVRMEENLHILTSGPILSNPSDLFATRYMEVFLKRMNDNYNVVIIKAPSLGGVADANILSNIADGTLLVCTARETSMEEVKRAKKILDKVNANILGVILNRVDLQEDNYYKYYYDNYMYYKDNVHE